jgi:RNase P/RNase MRP subunit p30
MNRAFADLHLRINPTDKTVEHCITKAAKLGYHQIAIPFTTLPPQDQILNLKSQCQQQGIEFILRADFKPRTEEDLMRFLRKYRRNFEVIAIICDNKDVARQAAKDRRVDLISFPSLDYHKRFFDRAQAELCSSGLAALEVDLKSILILEGPPRTRLLSSLRREVAIAKEFHIPVILSSGISEEHLMRMPQDMASLGYLFEMSQSETLASVAENPTNIILRNREKLASNFVAPGITVLKEGNAT